MQSILRSVTFILPFIFCLVFGHSLWAQYSYNSPIKESDFKEEGINQKLNGKVFLASGKTVEGGITIYHQLDLVRVKLADSTEAAYAPIAVQFIEGVDVQDGYSRLFKVLPYAYRMDNDYRPMPTFFEEVVSGTYALLIRRALESVYINQTKVPIKKAELNDRLNFKAPRIEDQIAYKFYLQVHDKDLATLKNPRKDLSLIYGAHSNEMRRYIKKNRLDYDDPNHLIRIVEHLNTLVK